MEKILAIKFPPKAELDLLGWHYNDNGIYKVKSGYWLSTHLLDSELIIRTWGDPLLKQKIWKCTSPPKIRHFIGKAISKSLAIGTNLDDMLLRLISVEDVVRHQKLSNIYFLSSLMQR